MKDVTVIFPRLLSIPCKRQPVFGITSQSTHLMHEPKEIPNHYTPPPYPPANFTALESLDSCRWSEVWQGLPWVCAWEWWTARWRQKTLCPWQDMGSRRGNRTQSRLSQFTEFLGQGAILFWARTKYRGERDQPHHKHTFFLNTHNAHPAWDDTKNPKLLPETTPKSSAKL